MKKIDASIKLIRSISDIYLNNDNNDGKGINYEGINDNNNNKVINIYLDRFKILEGISSSDNISDIIKQTYKKCCNESPEQLYLHPNEFKAVRCSAEEYALLINQNLIDDKNVDVENVNVENIDERFMGLINRGDLTYEEC